MTLENENTDNEMPTHSIWPNCQQTCYTPATTSSAASQQCYCFISGGLEDKQDDDTIENAVLLRLYLSNDLRGINFAVATVPALILTRYIRMLHDSLNKLLSAIQKDLEVDREMAELWGGSNLPEICLNVCLCNLAGESYSDTTYFCRHLFTEYCGRQQRQSTIVRARCCPSNFQLHLLKLATQPWLSNA